MNNFKNINKKIRYGFVLNMLLRNQKYNHLFNKQKILSLMTKFQEPKLFRLKKRGCLLSGRTMGVSWLRLSRYYTKQLIESGFFPGVKRSS